MTCVVDASVMLSLLLADEHTYGSEAFGNRLLNTEVSAPALLLSEVANGLVMAARRGRMPAEECLGSLAVFRSFNADTVPFGLEQIESYVALAQRHQLTVYDAAYLHVAIERDAVLLTLDRALRRAATAAGLTLFPAEPA